MADDAGELAALKPRVAAGEPTFEAFAGLRGVLALWIVLGHFTVSSTLASNLLNVYAMPGFFILSGFVLVQAYGRQRWAPFAWWGERRVEEGEERQEALQLFDVRRFLWRRAARLLPVYYLTNACGTLLAWLHTHGSGQCTGWFHGDKQARFAYQGVTTLLVVGTWFPFPGSSGGEFNGVAWFVSTVGFCYLTFPSLLATLQSCSRATLQHCIWGACITQLAMGPALMFMFINGLGYSTTAPWECGMMQCQTAIYKHPLFNLMQFVLGVLAGQIRAAGPSLLGAELKADTITDWPAIHTRWAVLVDATALATPVAVVGAAMTCLWIQTVVSQQLYIILGCLIQALFVVPFLLLVYGLTCDGGSSATSRALQLPPARWLGQISYSLYLSHNLIRQYVDAVRHSTGNPSQYPPQESYNHPYSAWLILPLAAVALLVGWLVWRFVEEPARIYLCQGSTAAAGRAWGAFGSFSKAEGQAAAGVDS